MRHFLNFLATLNAEQNAEGGEAPAAPAPAPAQPAPAPAPKQEPAPAPEADETDAADEPIQYDETGDATLDYVLGFIGSHGLGPDHPAVVSAQKGDFDQLEIELAKRDAKGADKVLNLARKSYEGYQGKQREAAEKTQQAIHQAVGGEEQWQEISKWASENAEPEEKDAINKMFEQGGFAAQVAASFLASKYRDASGTEYKGQQAASTPAPSKVQSNDNGPITRRELAEKAAPLRAKYGDDYLNSPEYRSLLNRVNR